MITLLNSTLTANGQIVTVKTSDIRLSEDSCRQNYNDTALFSLADSIARHGILTPLTVRPDSGGYEVVSGRRRLRAAVILHLPYLPCFILESDGMNNAELALIEDLQRESLNMFEQARLIARLIRENSLTQEETARRLSCSKSSIANKLRLLRFTPEEQTEILSTGLSERHARALLRIPDTEERMTVMHKVIRDDMNVASCESLVEETIGEYPHCPKEYLPRYICSVKEPTFFFNTVEKTASKLRDAGIPVESTTEENPEFASVTLRMMRSRR